jgi:L-alanine-DL-glutamate epimerase-like enolase superfamily enzyme
MMTGRSPVTAIDTVPIRIPLDIWTPPLMTHSAPRTHVEDLCIRVTTSSGVVGWGESLGHARAIVIAVFGTSP